MSLKGIQWTEQKIANGVRVASGMFALIELTVEMSGLIGQQTKVVFIILDFFFNVLEFAGYAAASVARQT